MAISVKKEPAGNLEELYNNLNVGEILDRVNAQFYVDLFEKEMGKIRYDLRINTSPVHTLYITGQSGSGKTTAMNFLADPVLESMYHVVRFYGRELLDLNDASVIDIMLMLNYLLIRETPALEKTFKKELDRIYQKHQGIQSEETVREHKRDSSTGGGMRLGISVAFQEFMQLLGLNTGADFFANLKIDSSYRKITRTAFEFTKRDLVDLTNKIIHEYTDKKAKGKQLLILFNDLDNIKTWDSIKSIFLGTDLNFLLHLECRKVISVPLIVRLKDFPFKIHFLGLKLKNKNDEGNNPELIQTNSRLLADVVRKRIREDAFLLEEGVLERAVALSGGIVRQLFHILQEAILENRGQRERLGREDLAEGAAVWGRALQSTLMDQEKMELALQVMLEKSYTTEQDELLTEMLQANQIIMYENDDMWCDINPLLEQNVSRYAERKQYKNENRD